MRSGKARLRVDAPCRCEVEGAWSDRDLTRVLPRDLVEVALGAMPGVANPE